MFIRHNRSGGELLRGTQGTRAKLTLKIPWLRIFVEDVVIVGSILLAFATPSTASQVQESFPHELDQRLDGGLTAGGVALFAGAATVYWG